MPTLLRAKCIIVGDSTVGKSAITQVFHSDGSHFPKTYQMTINCDLVTKAVNIPETQDSVELYLYDSSGKEIFTDIISKYWEHPSVLFLVYDVTNEMSFNSCAKWLERVRSQKPDVHIPGVLVANKTDLDDRRVVHAKVGEEFADSNGLKYFECSAKEMQNVEQPFYYLANAFYKIYKEKLEYFETLG